MPTTSPTPSMCSGIEAGLSDHAGALFPCGQLLATPAALDLLLQRGLSPLSMLSRHLRGDWGDIGEADRSVTTVLLPEDY